MKTKVSTSRLLELIVSLDDTAPRVIDIILASIAEKIVHLTEVKSTFETHQLAKRIIKECDSVGLLGVKGPCEALLNSTDQEALNGLINEVGVQFGIGYVEIVRFVSLYIIQESHETHSSAAH